MSSDIRLRNDHHVYILGAGFSAARGMPLIYSFLNRMRDAAIWFERQGRGSEKEAIQQVLKFRLSAAASAYRVPIDLENVEELFSLASASDQGITESVKHSIAATLAYCAAVFPEPYLYMGDAEVRKRGFLPFSKQISPSDSSTLQVPLYDVLVSELLLAADPSRSSVITFNYDDIVEKSVVSIGGAFHYGLSKRPEVEDGVKYCESGLAILKLHGSLNWGKAGDSLKVFKSYDTLLATGQAPQIVPPTWNKAIEDQLSEVWAAAIEKLSTATKIFVIGFSMPKTDLHFKYLLAAGMRDNFSLREIVFVDPKDAEIRSRANEMLASREIDNGRVRFVQSRVEQLIGNTVPEVAGRYVAANSAVLQNALAGVAQV